MLAMIRYIDEEMKRYPLGSGLDRSYRVLERCRERAIQLLEGTDP